MIIKMSLTLTMKGLIKKNGGETATHFSLHSLKVQVKSKKHIIAKVHITLWLIGRF